MVRGIEGNEMSTPKPKPKPTPSQSGKQQKTLLGFFQKKAAPPTPSDSSKNVPPQAAATRMPTPSSSFEHVALSSPLPVGASSQPGTNKENGLPSPVTSELQEGADGAGVEGPSATFSSPSRRVSRTQIVPQVSNPDRI